MNAETRAKEIARILRDAIVAESNGKFDADDMDGRIWFECGDSNAAVDCEVVAAALMPLITRAENDKLEEAAAAYDEVHAERGLGVRGQPNLFSMWLRRWAQYQSLKSKDTP